VLNGGLVCCIPKSRLRCVCAGLVTTSHVPDFQILLQTPHKSLGQNFSLVFIHVIFHQAAEGGKGEDVAGLELLLLLHVVTLDCLTAEVVDFATQLVQAHNHVVVVFIAAAGIAVVVVVKAVGSVLQV